MRMRVVSIVGVALLLVGWSGCGGKHQGTGRIYDKEHGFSIVPPSGFTDTGPSFGNFMVLGGPIEGGFLVNVNVNANRDDGTLVEEAAGPQMKAALRRVLTGYEVLHEQFLRIGGRKAYVVSATFQQGEFKLRNLQYIVPGGRDQVFVVTFTTPLATFERFRPSFESSASTIRAD